MTKLTGSMFDGHLGLNMQKPPVETTIVPFPKKEKPADLLTSTVERLNTKFESGDMKGLFGVSIDANNNIDIFVAGGVTNLNNYLLVAAVLDSMRHKIIERASAEVIKSF
jgi:hypothetical protein